MNSARSSSAETGGATKALNRTQLAGVLAGPLLLRALYSTWRIREINGDGWRALRARGQPFVFALWHGQLLPLVVRHRRQGVKVLISEHRDGEVIARIAARLGLGTIRGSTSRGAARALLAMCEALGSGSEVAVTPDGPRGPARKFAGGAIVAAHRANAPIVPIGVAASHAWRLHSWDGFMIPKPFSTVTIAYGDPIYVKATDARAAAARTEEFESALNAAVSRAESAEEE